MATSNNAIFNILKQLYENELYDSVLELGSLLLTCCERCTEFLPHNFRFQCTVYYADALFNLQFFKKAEQFYMKALHLRKSHVRPSDSKKYSSLTSEIDIKYQLYLCLLRQRKFQEAVGLLESIPMKSRSPKISVALVKLYKQLGKDTYAADNCRHVLKLCPYAIDIVSDLLNLGSGKAVYMSEIEGYMADYPSNSLWEMDWFKRWIYVKGDMASKNYPLAVKQFKELDSSTLISNNVTLLCNLGKAYYFAGEYSRAISVLQRVHSLDPLYLDAIDMLANMLYVEKRNKELEGLANRLLSVYDNSCRDNLEESPCPMVLCYPEPWTVLGYFCLLSGKLPRSLYFAHKACNIGPWANEEALLLKGLVLLESKKLVEATLHFKDALQTAPHRYEIHQGLVNTYLARQKHKEAIAAARVCTEQLHKSPRSLALYALVLSGHSESLEKAESLLENVVTNAPYLLGAVQQLVQIYDKQKKYEKAIELLRKQTSMHVKSQLHQLLGDLLVKANRGTEALDRYRYALTLDPENAELRKGMVELEDELRTGQLNFQSDNGDEPLDILDAAVTPEDQRPQIGYLTNAPNVSHRRGLFLSRARTSQQRINEQSSNDGGSGGSVGTPTNMTAIIDLDIEAPPWEDDTF